MHKMTRAKALNAIRAAGAQNDQKSFIRLYTENRISLAVAKQAFSEGRKLAAFVEARG